MKSLVFESGRAASPRPGRIEEHDDACFIVKDATGRRVDLG